MKMLPVFLPATAPPARNKFGIALERLWIQRRRQRFGITFDSSAAHELDVGVISGQQEHRLCGQRLQRSLPLNHDLCWANLDYTRFKTRCNRTFLDAVVDVGPDPVFDRVSQRGTPMDERHVHTRRAPVPPRPLSSFRRRSRRAGGNADALRCNSERRVADPHRDTQAVRQIVVPDREDDGSRCLTRVPLRLFVVTVNVPSFSRSIC